MADIAASVPAKPENTAKATGIRYPQCLRLFFQQALKISCTFVETTAL